ncbi:hypothetical protein DL768_006693 [Monosporascus sp. mg162]|nr:hypothetical protein DL768_006693 [Monosporascus sp. mg162]
MPTFFAAGQRDRAQQSVKKMRELTNTETREFERLAPPITLLKSFPIRVESKADAFTKAPALLQSTWIMPQHAEASVMLYREYSMAKILEDTGLAPDGDVDKPRGFVEKPLQWERRPLFEQFDLERQSNGHNGVHLGGISIARISDDAIMRAEVEAIPPQSTDCKVDCAIAKPTPPI